MRKSNANAGNVYYGKTDDSDAANNMVPLDKDYTPVLFGVAILAAGGIILPFIAASLH